MAHDNAWQRFKETLTDEGSVVLTNYVKNSRLRVVANRYGDAGAACAAWCDGQLWGNPIRYSDQNIHVYGLYLRNWSKVNVQFLRDRIVIVKPPAPQQRYIVSTPPAE